ncbi:MAG: sulfur carrier protein ThiS [Synergistaceae bacterium]|jgi:sulfur carrier protein|nr:sulfur carrier protein ThiS [Synergistaceae bacterium]
MKLIIAGVQKEYQDGLTVAELIKVENVETPMYVSVSLNDEFVKSGEYDETVLRDDDVVEFLYFMGGGR